MVFEKKLHGDVDVEGVYYALYLSTRTELITIVCLQDFDEDDYRFTRFVRNGANEVHVFDTEDDAKIYLNEHFEPEEIESEYRDDVTDRRLIRE